MNILNSLPAGTILTALSLLGVTLYADSKITGSYGQSTYRPALHEHIKNIFTADDCAALIGICRIKSAYEDIIHADYCNIPNEINFEHMRNAFYPVMPGSCREKFGGFTDMYRKFSGFMKNVSSADGEKDKNMAVISSLADIMENDTLTNMLRMKDTLSSLSFRLWLPMKKIPVRKKKISARISAIWFRKTAQDQTSTIPTENMMRYLNS